MADNIPVPNDEDYFNMVLCFVVLFFYKSIKESGLSLIMPSYPIFFN